MDIFIPKNSYSPITPQCTKRDNFGNTPAIKNSLSEVNTGDAVFRVEVSMDGTKNATYHINLIKLLDRVFLYNSLNFVSVEQERFLNIFFKQAGIIDKYINTNEVNIYKDADSIMQQLDNFLGSYYGVNNG